MKNALVALFFRVIPPTKDRAPMLKNYGIDTPKKASYQETLSPLSFTMHKHMETTHEIEVLISKIKHTHFIACFQEWIT
jgi:hypothetical protein